MNQNQVTEKRNIVTNGRKPTQKQTPVTPATPNMVSLACRPPPHTCQPSRFSRETPDIHYPLPFSSRCKKSPAILLISDKISCLPFSPLSSSSQQPVLQKRILFERARCYHGDVCRRSVVTAGATNQRRRNQSETSL